MTFDEKARQVMAQYGCDYYAACSILGKRAARKRAALKARRERERNTEVGRQCLPERDR